MSIGSRIKYLRKKNNMTQKELGGDFINRIVLGRIENDLMVPSINQLDYIAKRLDCDINYLITDVNRNDNGYNRRPIERCTILSEMYKKGEYIEIVKGIEAGYIEDDEDYNKMFYIGMSYFTLNVYYEAIKPLKKYKNLYLSSHNDIQQEYIINFLTALNTLFKIMVKNQNYKKCESYLMLAQKYIVKYNAENSYVGFSIYNNLAYVYLKECKYIETISL